MAESSVKCVKGIQKYVLVLSSTIVGTIAEISGNFRKLCKRPMAEIDGNFSKVCKRPIAEIGGNFSKVCKRPMAEIDGNFSKVCKRPIAELLESSVKCVKGL